MRSSLLHDSCRKQRYMSTLILCFVFERFTNILRRHRSGTIESVELEWNIFPGYEIRRKVAQNGIKPEEFEYRINLMYNDIDWSKGEENFRKCVLRTLRKLQLTHTDSRTDTGLSSDQEKKKTGMECTRTSPNVSGTAQQI